MVSPGSRLLEGMTYSSVSSVGSKPESFVGWEVWLALEGEHFLGRKEPSTRRRQQPEKVVVNEGVYRIAILPAVPR